MPDNTASRGTLKCRIVYSAVGVLIGLSVFLAWLLAIEHAEATVHIILAGGLSGALAAWNLVTHIMHLQDYWRTWLKGLRFFMACGLIFMIITTAGFITYIVLAATKHQELTVTSYYIASVWCFISFKWAAFLLWHSRSYRNEFSDLSLLLNF